MGYHHHRRREFSGPNARAERIATVVILVLLVAVLVLFLFVYHDVPLRTA
jgi:hypothetical protein